jgi:hypothetical protein
MNSNQGPSFSQYIAHTATGTAGIASGVWVFVTPFWTALALGTISLGCFIQYFLLMARFGKKN